MYQMFRELKSVFCNIQKCKFDQFLIKKARFLQNLQNTQSFNQKTRGTCINYLQSIKDSTKFFKFQSKMPKNLKNMLKIQNFI
jgi:hypothetical protein